MSFCIRFALLGAAILGLALVRGGMCLFWLWPAGNVLLLSYAYGARRPSVFGKSADGRLSILARVVFWPYLVGQHVVWHLRRIAMRGPSYQSLTAEIRIGRRLLSHEVPDDVDHVVDLTCEFTEPFQLRSRCYHLFAILDGDAPEPEQLLEWVRQISEMKGRIYIHCAVGYGRTGLMAAACLLISGRARTPHEAVIAVQACRPGVRLNARQWDVLNRITPADCQCVEIPS